MNYQIRELKTSDMDAVTKLYLSAYCDDVWGEKWLQKDAESRITEIMSSPGALSLVCIAENEIVGCILCSLMSWHTGKQLEVKELFVSPSYQKTGIGCLLMKQIEETALELGVTELFLWTKNEAKLVNFYKNNGYNFVKDTIQMTKKFRR